MEEQTHMPHEEPARTGRYVGVLANPAAVSARQLRARLGKTVLVAANLPSGTDVCAFDESVVVHFTHLGAVLTRGNRALLEESGLFALVEEEPAVVLPPPPPKDGEPPPKLPIPSCDEESPTITATWGMRATRADRSTF